MGVDAMFETILVPTDGSDHANRAVALAAELADKYKARIVILHVLLRDASVSELVTLCESFYRTDELIKKLLETEATLISAAAAGAYVPVPVPQDLLEEVGALITGRAEQFVMGKDVSGIEVQVCDGSAANLILAAAEHESADVIVMGSRGLGHIKGMLMGSVSHKVNHLSKCTCITVK